MDTVVGPDMKSFGTMGKELLVLKGGKEAELFKHEGKGCLTHMWFGGSFPTYMRTRIRVYVDGESKASIDMAMGPGHGMGYEPESAPWGVTRIGQTGKPSGIYNTYRIPFAKSVRVTAQLADNERDPNPLFWWIIRGVENMPIVFNGLRLPDTARLHLYTREDYKARRLEEFDMCGVKGAGMLYQTTMLAKSTNLNFMEACIRAYIDGSKTPLWLSSGLEDYFLGTYYFNAGKYQNPVAGLTHLNPSDNSFTAYRFHEEDPIFFHKAFRLTCRCGEEIDGKVFGDPQETTYTTYVWVYEW